VILFELLCPVRTKMERAVVLEKFKHAHCLPEQVKTNFPTAARLATAMTNADPKERPTLCKLLKIMPKVLCEMRQHACSCLPSAPQIEEVEEQSIARWPQPEHVLDGGLSLEVGASDEMHEAVLAAPSPAERAQQSTTLDISQDQGVQKSCGDIATETAVASEPPSPEEPRVAQEKHVQEPIQADNLLHLVSQKGLGPDCKSAVRPQQHARALKKHARPHKDTSVIRLDLPFFIFLLIMDRMGHDMSQSTIRISLGQPAHKGNEVLATFDFAQQPDTGHGFVSVVAMETASKYMSDHKATTFICSACDTNNEDQASNRACDVWSGFLS